MKNKIVAVDAPCKINLHLAVKEKIAGGYHNIESVFQLVSLCDTLFAKKTETKGECRVSCGGMRLPADNTLARAVLAFREKTGIDCGVAFELEKRVPSGAGLGGGSSDGAAALRALDVLHGTGLTPDELEEMAIKIGSDCPFFVRGFPSFVCGRGEKILAFGASRRLFGIIIWPEVHSATNEAYALLDLSRSPKSGSNELFQFDFASAKEEYFRPPKEWRFCNSFTGLLCKKHPPIARALADIKKSGALFCEMTGTGSAVFGVFEDEAARDEAFNSLFRLWPSCHAFFFLDFSPKVN